MDVTTKDAKVTKILDRKVGMLLRPEARMRHNIFYAGLGWSK
jgi:hypothetical protein